MIRVQGVPRVSSEKYLVIRNAGSVHLTVQPGLRRKTKFAAPYEFQNKTIRGNGVKLGHTSTGCHSG